MLFERYPELRNRLPWVCLTKLPTPVRQLACLGTRLGVSDLWMKRDDISGLGYGGNKPRKLEFLLGDALSRGAKTIITFGRIGSNHVLCSALYAQRLNLGVIGILMPEPLSPTLQRNQCAIQDVAIKTIVATSTFRASVIAVTQFILQYFSDRFTRPYVILPGGSDARGSLGFVEAAFELADQIKRGECVEPDEIFVAVGTGGTLAGLLLGIRLAGIRSRLIGIQVSKYPLSNPRNIAWLANRTCRLLESQLGRTLNVKISARDVILNRDYLGRGYGYSTSDGIHAARLMSDYEDIELDDIYTAKAFAAVVNSCKENATSKYRVMFWNTYNSNSVNEVMVEGGYSVPEAMN